MIDIIHANKNNLQDTISLFEKYRSFYGIPNDFDAARQFISERLTKQDSLIFLAYKKNTAVGFMQIYHSFSSVAMQPIWILNDLFIDPAARRTGCATKMMKYIDIRAKKDGIFSIKLATAVTNKKAKALYDSLEYQLNQNFDNYNKSVK